MMKPMIFVLGLILSVSSYAAERCSTRAPTSHEVQKIESQLKLFETLGLNLEKSFNQNGESVKVYAHVLSSGPSPEEGNISDESIMKQIQVLNDAYSGLNSGNNTLFRFELAGIDRTINKAWFEADLDTKDEAQMKKALRQGGAADLNLYFIADNGQDFGWASPIWMDDTALVLDGVSVNFQTLLGGKYGDQYSLGKTAVHEVGHWLGLYHTFEGGCKGGDLVADTAPEKDSTSGCPAKKQTCGKKTFDPIHNYMDYSDDSCMTEFTAGQIKRMTQLFVQYRKAK